MIFYDRFDLINFLLEKGLLSINENTYILNDSIFMPQSLGFEDVAILQNKNICKSRLDVDITSEIIRGIYRPIPLIASNMYSVVNAEFINTLYELGAFGILHRAFPNDILVKETREIAKVCKYVGVSIGIGDDQFELAKKLIDAGANIITIDVAHGYSNYVIELGRKIKKSFPVKLILGNTHNINMLYEVNDFCDALKVGLSNGFVCSTKNTASCYEKQFTSVLKFKEISQQLGMPIISDGGIREPSCFVKAIAGGANSVMAGSIFARCPESSADIVEIDGQRKKMYFGMASKVMQDIWKGGVKSGTCPEGKVKYLDIGESVKKLLERYSGALRSGITYGGANNISDFQKNVIFTKI